MSMHTGMVGVTKTYRAEVTITEPKNRSNQMAKKSERLPVLPEVDEKGFFQIFADVKIGGVVYDAGAWLKRLSASESGKTWVVRAKYHKDSSAVQVRSAIFVK